MIKLKNSLQLAAMQDSCKLTVEALYEGASLIAPGVEIGEIDQRIRQYIEKHKGTPSFLGYAGFPKSSCISVNDVVIHGIPGHQVLEEGDIVSIDVGAFYKGFHGDCARTFPCGTISLEAKRLIEVTEASFYAGLAEVKPCNRVGDISAAVQRTAEAAGFSVVREYIGHGVGENLHEAPDIPNFGVAGKGPRLYAGMTIAIEPMINYGQKEVRQLSDGWTVVTLDGSLSAHYENTVAVTSDGAKILTEL
ncbi:MAG: type I methionyl aminopeptidase [Clostridia bacterium]|nr:type I methionyl aminopeptidase [Clostridia bacterium]